VVWGGKTMEQNYHVIARDQRFAYDILMTKGGATHEGDGRKLTDYYCYLQPIVAPAAGTVVTAVDGIPDQAPGEMNPAQKAGNHVILDHGNGEYSLLAHLHRGSVRVKPGQKIAEGDTLGLCGNSGNTSEPHLHYHLQNGPTFGDADGLPAQFVDYVADDKPVARGIPVHGQIVRRAQ
jgi:murein DD-endopeptidase MepM/ murein hydrolase activator NlpD